MKSQKGKLKIPIFDCIMMPLLCVLCFITIYPFLYCLAYSLSDSVQAMVKNITFLPVQPTLDHFAIVFKTRQISTSFLISLFRTVVGTLFAVIVTGMAAYALSKKTMPGNRIFSLFLIIPMYFGGGLIPYYVLIVKLKLINNLLVYILPFGFGAFNMLVMRTYFNTLPAEIEESARLDGANDLTIFLRLIIPLSMPIVATIAMFVGVFQWNSWFDAMMFTTKPELEPVQLLLQKLLMSGLTSDLASTAFTSLNTRSSPESIKMATVIVSTIPIIIIYPFFQRYFVKGIMIGAIKA